MPEPELKLFEEANRQLVICNACRYCEGLCPVFRAIETRREFTKGDVFYLANLCHDCRACYYACMFTPPHEFGINIPQILSEARVESYQAVELAGFAARVLSKSRESFCFWRMSPLRLLSLRLSRGLVPSRSLHRTPGRVRFTRSSPIRRW